MDLLKQLVFRQTEFVLIAGAVKKINFKFI